MSLDLSGLERSATLSDCGRFRFVLRRTWGKGPTVSWLMLNPSTADAEQDDPTLRRIMDFAAQWGMVGVTVVNVFPFRSSKPTELWRGLDKGPDSDITAIDANVQHIEHAASEGALRMLGFGADVPARYPVALDLALSAFGDGAMCLGTNADGWPLHPMARGKHRVPSYAKPTFWSRPQRSTT